MSIRCKRCDAAKMPPDLVLSIADKALRYCVRRSRMARWPAEEAAECRSIAALAVVEAEACSPARMMATSRSGRTSVGWWERPGIEANDFGFRDKCHRKRIEIRE